MNEFAKSKIKDDILKSILNSDRHSLSVNEIADKLKLDFNLVNYLCDELIEEDLFESIPITSLAGEKNLEANRYDKILTLNSKGIFLIENDGGFAKRHKRQRFRDIWNIIKIIAGTLNALAIVVLAYYNLHITKRQSNSEEIIKNQELIIDSLKKENEKVDYFPSESDTINNNVR